MTPKRIVLLGATGSIGKSVLDVVESRPDLFQLVALSAHSSEALLLTAAERLCPKAALCLSGRGSASERIAFRGPEGLDRMVREVSADIVLNGITGTAGLRPSFAALESGKDLALANKETIVLAGRLIEETARRNGRGLIPVDSEHSAIFQMLQRFGPESLDEIILTASGGAFRDKPLEELEDVTPEEASRHPNWSMGRKITIDSASMANKGLEVIEAVRLFGVSPDRVRVLIHPQSQVHSLIRTRDGVLYAQISGADMRVAIQSALTWPRMEISSFGRLDLAGHTLTFQNPDLLKYPLLKIAYMAVEAGEGYTIAYNASNEVAVDLFINGRIRFTDIARVVDATLSEAWPDTVHSLREVYELDAEARGIANAAVGRIATRW